MAAMRWFVGLICCLSLTAGEVTQLRQLQEHNRIFQLREALEQPGWNDSETLFYRALVESRFGHDQAAITDLQKFLAAPASVDLKRKAYEELASALLRVGRYGDSAGAMAEALRITPRDDPDRAGDENDRKLYQSLADVPPQTIAFGEDVATRASHNPLGSWDVPVEVNGHEAKWIFDTGANLSTVTESEAAKLGLALRDSSAYVKGSTDKKNPLRLAVAHDLRFGNARLSNVVLLVLPDQTLYVGPLKYQIRGILGLPVLRALGCVGISAKGEVRIERKETGAAGAPNLFLDEWNLIVEARHGGHRLEMFLDTGANQSFGYPSLRETLMPVEIARFKQPTGHNSYRDGVLGMDSLAGGFTLDFRAMQLRLD
jgi:hypothetical protein